jgi:uncharacterized protein
VAAGPVDAAHSPHATLRPLPFGVARIEDGFWAARQRLCRDVLLPEGARRLEEAGNLDNLRSAAGRREGAFRGLPFMDSDVYKWLEALGWELGRAPSAELEADADATIDVIAAAQEPSGYLNSYYQVARPGERFSNLSWDHELYCLGHLIQAALAHARARGDERLLAVARRFADHVDGIFGPGRRDGVPGHPEVETALVELYRHTGAERYLRLAQFFVDARGRGTLPDARFGSGYWQDHAPVRQAPEITGHAVRALYLAAGVTDLYLERGEPALLSAMQRWWADMAGRKAYLTGAVGAHHADEAFGDAYELPPDRGYGETCAAIASVQWNWRMLLATGDARFADLFERTLYNGFLAGLALDGSAYSYVNPLHVRPGRGAVRWPWFPCACCPPNVMRLLASLDAYLATTDAGGLQVHNYASADLGGVRVRTGFPYDGRVRLEVRAARAEPWTLSLRVPAWSRDARVEVCGEPAVAASPGYVRLRRAWRVGDEVVLTLDMAPRFVAPHPRIDAVRGCLAIERGPLVYCVEQADLPAGADLDDLRLDPAASLRDAPGPVAGAPAVTVAGRHVPPSPTPPGAWPYGPPAAVGGGAGSAISLPAVPYFAWGNRGEGPMRVWLPADAGKP